MRAQEIKEKLLQHEFDHALKQCVVDRSLEKEALRYCQLLNRAEECFPNREWHLFSAPGRSEIGGNHTDHQHGSVLAASVNLDMIAAAARQEARIQVISEGFEPIVIEIEDLSVHASERNSSAALIRGICAGFQQRGWKVGGLIAYCQSNILPGSGISSSAAFEILIGTILSHLYNEGKVSPVELAQIGQFAENVYFQKPCGLLDQMACSVGGLISIDFEDPKNSRVEKVEVDFSSRYALCLINTGGSHSDLSEEYGRMPQEMKEVACFFNKEVLRKITMEEMLQKTAELRRQVNDRAWLRAFHFLHEQQRVEKEVQALKNKDWQQFLKLIVESGQSSYMYLQNVIGAGQIQHQDLAVALALSEHLLKDKGAWRVHGGGLAGTIQAFVPYEYLDEYRQQMEAVFGEGSCLCLAIRPVGGMALL